MAAVDLWDAGHTGGHVDVGGRRLGVGGRRRHLGDADECPSSRDAVWEAAWGARDVVQPSSAARRRLPRTPVRVTTWRPAAVHAADRYDRALERRPRCTELQTGLPAAMATATGPRRPRRGTSTPSCRYDSICRAAARRLSQSERLRPGERYDLRRQLLLFVTCGGHQLGGR